LQFPRENAGVLARSVTNCRFVEIGVQRVLALLPGETDLAIRLNLCEALLDHFSFEGVEPACQLIKEQQLTPDLRHLRSNLIATCKIMGTRFPEFDRWHEEAKSDAQEEWAKMQEIQKLAFEAGGDLGLLVRKLKTQLAEQQREQKRLEAEVVETERLLARKPSPRPMPGRLHGREVRGDSSSSRKPSRIGRNDPCPCGSGKKFKHCCKRT
jgi:hypothetical protein